MRMIVPGVKVAGQPCMIVRHENGGGWYITNCRSGGKRRALDLERGTWFKLNERLYQGRLWLECSFSAVLDTVWDYSGQSRSPEYDQYDQEDDIIEPQGGGNDRESDDNQGAALHLDSGSERAPQFSYISS